MAAPAIQTGHTKGADTSSTTTTTVTHPSTAPSGDKVFICMGSDPSGQTFSYDGSFTELYVDESFQSAASASVAYKTSGGSEANYSVTLGTSERQAWIAFSVTGAGAIHGTPPASNSGSSGTATFPAITTTKNDCLLIRVVITDPSAGDTTPFGAMSGSGWTKLDEIYGTSAAGVGVFYKVLATAGTEASGTATLNVSEQWWTATFAIEPSTTLTDVSITISRTNTAAASGRATAGSSVSTSRTNAVSSGGGASAGSSFLAALSKQVVSAGIATAAAALGLTLQQSISSSGRAASLATIATGIIRSTQVNAKKIVSVDLPVDQTKSSAIAGFPIFAVAMSIARSMDTSLVTHIDAVALVELAHEIASSAAGEATAEATILFQENIALLLAGKPTFPVSLSVNKQISTNVNRRATIFVAIPFDLSRGATLTAASTIEVALPDLTRTLSALITSGLIVNVEFGTSFAVQVSFSPDVQKFHLVIYPTRLLVVGARTKILTVQAETRYLVVGSAG